MFSNGGSNGQDGGIGRYTLLPCKTKRRTTTNLKTENNQNCQKIELYGSPTTKELKKKHSSRPLGGAKTGSRGGEDSPQGSGWRTQRGSGWWSRQSHLCVRINWEKQLGSKTDCTGFQCREIKPQNLWLKKICGGWGSRRNSQPQRRVLWRDPQGPRTYTKPPTHLGISTRRAQFACG